MDTIITKLEEIGAEPGLALEETFLDDLDSYREQLAHFTRDKNMETLRASLVPEKKETAMRAAHTLKGIADTLGLLPLVDSSYSVMADLREDRLDLAIEDMKELEAVYAKFIAILINVKP